MTEKLSTMASANAFDPNLPSNQMVFEIRRNNDVWPTFPDKYEEIMEQYGLSEEEREAFRNVDVKRLGEMGVHPYFLPQITRLFHGAGHNTSKSRAAESYRRSFGGSIVE